MASRCPRGTVRIGQRLALRVLDWHGGAGYPSYSVGSSGYAGHCVSKSLVRRAIDEFKDVLRTSGKLAARKSLERVIAALEKKVEG
jgi:hypothetical protein